MIDILFAAEGKNRVKGISYENWVWVWGYEFWVMDDAQSKHALN